MAKDRDEQLNQDEFSLDSILAEFGTPAAGETAPVRDELGEKDWFPTPPKTERPSVQESPTEAPPAQPVKGKGNVTQFPKAPPKIVREAAPPPPPEPEPEVEPEPENNVLEFPTPEPSNPVAAGIENLRKKADQFADHMFEEEGKEAAKAVRRAEKLIPGVDEEETPPPAPRERKPRKRLPPPPDRPPAELAKMYARGLKGLHLRSILVLLLLPVSIYLTAAPDMGWSLPLQLTGRADLLCDTLAGIHVLALLLGVDEFAKGLLCPFRHRMGMEFLISLSQIAVLVDAIAIPYSGTTRIPFSAVAILSLWCVMYGSCQERKGMRLACRVAAATSEPYLVTRDEGKWNNRDTYTKWSGTIHGFGSQIQNGDGARRVYKVAVPLLLVASVVFSLLASVGQGRKENFLWCLAAILTAAGSLSATLCFGMPWRKISARLSKSGAALAGWQGVVNTTGSSNLLLTDIDLFPVGSVSLNGVKIFGDAPIEKVVAVTATVIRDSGSGLDKIFHDLLRSQGAVYRRGEDLTAFEGGGVSEIIRGQQILVGSAAFMVLMNVALPSGLKVKNAVFCAIDGELAGIFALNYHLPDTVPLAIDSLIRNKITPVLATRDFNLIPSMLRQRFKLPAEKLEFPSVNRRRELSEPEQEHSDTLTAVLCREGLAPYAEAVVGSRRLRTSVRLSVTLSCIGSVVGTLLAFYLTSVAAFDSLTPLNLLLFLLMWLVPTPLIAGWVDQY